MWHTVDWDYMHPCLSMQVSNHSPTVAHVHGGAICPEGDERLHPWSPILLWENCTKCSLGGIQNTSNDNTKVNCKLQTKFYPLRIMIKLYTRIKPLKRNNLPMAWKCSRVCQPGDWLASHPLTSTFRQSHMVLDVSVSQCIRTTRYLAADRLSLIMSAIWPIISAHLTSLSYVGLMSTPLTPLPPLLLLRQQHLLPQDCLHCFSTLNRYRSLHWICCREMLCFATLSFYQFPDMNDEFPACFCPLQYL